MDFVNVKLDRLHAVIREPEVRINCGCGSVFTDTPHRRISHMNTQKHQRFEHEWFMGLTEDQVKAMLKTGALHTEGKKIITNIYI